MKASILIVEADAATRQTMLALFAGSEIEAFSASDLATALSTLDQTPIDLVVTDLPQRPRQSRSASTGDWDAGLTLYTSRVIDWVQRFREAAPGVPIVLTTCEDCDPAACEALLRGAASYVPRSLASKTLRETVEQVLVVSSAHRDATEVDQCVSRVKLELTLPSHEGLVPGVIAKLEEAVAPLDLFDEMVWTQIAMALDEAILNAMIHGNLEVDSALREVGDGSAFWETIRQRREESPYSQRRTEVILMATRSQAVFVVRDQGPGFDIHSLPDPTDPANLESIGGRGMLLIAAFMDEIHHNDVGNELTMIKRKAAGIRDEDE